MSCVFYWLGLISFFVSDQRMETAQIFNDKVLQDAFSLILFPTDCHRSF